MPEKAPKGKELIEKGPGDFKGKPNVPSFRGDKGSSDAKAPEETSSVHYDK